MNCPQCMNGMVEAQASLAGGKYWYCRTCKKELAEMQGMTPKAVAFDTETCLQAYQPSAQGFTAPKLGRYSVRGTIARSSGPTFPDCIEDFSGTEQCRSIQGTSTHFWKALPFNGIRDCECSAYSGDPTVTQVKETYSGKIVGPIVWGHKMQPSPQQIQNLSRPAGRGASPALAAPYGSTPNPSPPGACFAQGQAVMWLGCTGNVKSVRHSSAHKRMIAVVTFDDESLLRRALTKHGCYGVLSRYIGFDPTTGMRVMPRMNRLQGADLTTPLTLNPTVGHFHRSLNYGVQAANIPVRHSFAGDDEDSI